MRNFWKTMTVRLVAVMLAAGIMSWADDLVVPSFRGWDGSTYQEWRFDTNADPASPENVTNPHGSPVADITVGLYGSGWLNYYPVLGSKQGYWDLGRSGTIVASIPEQPNPPSGWIRWVAVQTTYFVDITQAPAITVAQASKTSEEIRTVENAPYGGAWKWTRNVWRVDVPSATDLVTITADAAWFSVVDQTVVDTVMAYSASSAGAVRQLPDGTAVEVLGPVVTRSFQGFFYIEDPLRMSGIRVNRAIGSLPAEGNVPRVFGVLRTVEGERVIDEAEVTNGVTATIPRPLAMICRATIRDLSPQGLLVCLCGRATVATPGQPWFMIDDGSPQPVKIELYGIGPPLDGQFVTVTGALGADAGGPVLRAGPSDTITVPE